MKDDSSDNVEVLESGEVSERNREEIKKRDEYREKLARKGIKRQSQDTKRALIVKMSMQGIGSKTISDVVKLPVKTVESIRERFLKEFKELNEVDTFREAKSDIIEAIQLKALKFAVSDKKLNKSSFLATISGVEKLQRIQRLNDDQSTSNTAIVFGGIGDKNE